MCCNETTTIYAVEYQASGIQTEALKSCAYHTYVKLIIACIELKTTGGLQWKVSNITTTVLVSIGNCMYLYTIKE